MKPPRSGYNGGGSCRIRKVVVLSRIVDKFEIGDEVVVEIIGDDANGVLAIYRVTRIKREPLFPPGEHIVTQLITIRGVVIAVIGIELDIICELIADLRRDLHRCARVCMQNSK